ncbi:hypothetical protein C8J31_105139 [Rhizobium sp. PP-CC-2G-626]|nr:hypothetical protein C8J31_105139 [Rhizobium sp. PP-CC-2G-626]
MTDPLASLPMFATDKQIAVGVVGKERLPRESRRISTSKRSMKMVHW